MTQLEPNWITGFVDGEGCFFVGLNKNTTMKTGFQLLPEFTVTQHQRDVQILYALKDFWGCGVVRKNHGDRFCYRVRGIYHLQTIIIPFFEQHCLKTKKKIDFLKFRRILHFMEKKEHLTVPGLLTVDALRLSMNRGRSNTLKTPMGPNKKELVLINDVLVLRPIIE